MASRQPSTDHENPDPELSQAHPPQGYTSRIDSRFPRRAFLGSTATLALAVLAPELAKAHQLPPPKEYPAPRSEPATPPTMPRITIVPGCARDVTSVCFSPDGQFIGIGNFDSPVHLWDLSTGKMIRIFKGHSDHATEVCFSPDGRFMLTGTLRNIAELWEVATGNFIRTFEGLSNPVFSVCFSPDSRFILTGSDDRTARLWDIATGKVIQTFDGHLDNVVSVCFSPDGRFVLTGSWDTTARLWDAATGKEIRVFKGHNDLVWSVCFSRDGKFVLTGGSDKTARLWESSTGTLVRTFEGGLGSVLSACFSPDEKFVLTGCGDNMVRLWETATGKAIRTFQGHSDYVRSACFSPDGRFMLSGSHDGTARLRETATGKEIVFLINDGNALPDDSWVVVAPDGHFDGSDPNEIWGLHWIAPDDPLHPLPLEIVQRQYYEPGLLKYLCNGEKLPPQPPLTTLNRVQPKVAITEVRIAPDGTATVSVDVASVIKRGRVSGAFDLRLFRDGQLVGVRMGELKDGQITFPGIRLPKRAGIEVVEFSAYCFNKDRVKSSTAKDTMGIRARPEAPPVLRRAFVICVGVDSSQDKGLALRYAVRDAQATADAVSARLRAAGQYAEVVTIQLLAPASATGPNAVTATKADLQAVLAKLAGKTPRGMDTRLSRIPGADKLQPATPDDLLFLSFSGHGYTGPGGIFYLLPYDIGKGRGMTPERLKRCISSDDLASWLLYVDAGDIALILDAGHSASAIDGDGNFKPGPFGNPGLGQLAYDKRMLLLAATQASNIALESESLGHGLLTYALIKDGLEANKAMMGPPGSHLTLSSWLSYGAKRVPELWEDSSRTSKGQLPRGITGKRRDRQQPTLFDFSKKAGTERDPWL